MQGDFEFHTAPRRIVCLTEETVEALYLMGAGDLVVGVSGYAERPIAARAKPKVSAFINANFDRIAALEPDLVLTFSDLQAEITAELMKRGMNVVGFNQRSIAEILEMILTLGRIVDHAAAAADVVASLVERIAAARRRAAALPARPRVYFEEWDEPMIAGIRWTSEAIEFAGGIETFPEHRAAGLARDRITQGARVIERAPDLILASWCGKKVDLDSIRQRPGWHAMPAVRRGQVVELDPIIVLQPGPALLTDGLDAIADAVARAAAAMVNDP